jgi:predicted Fe-S protein YdhL (DUF1289 family)
MPPMIPKPEIARPTEPALRVAEPMSPCNLVCKLDPATKLCIGCHRTIDEISAWPVLTPAQKQVVLAALDERRTSNPFSDPVNRPVN